MRDEKDRMKELERQTRKLESALALIASKESVLRIASGVR